MPRPGSMSRHQGLRRSNPPPVGEIGRVDRPGRWAAGTVPDDGPVGGPIQANAGRADLPTSRRARIPYRPGVGAGARRRRRTNQWRRSARWDGDRGAIRGIRGATPRSVVVDGVLQRKSWRRHQPRRWRTVRQCDRLYSPVPEVNDHIENPRATARAWRVPAPRGGAHQSSPPGHEGLIQAYARGQLVRRNPGMGAELTGPAQGAVFLG